MAIVDPKLIGILEVVGNVQFRRAIAVEIVEPGRKAELLWGRREHPATLVAKPRGVDHRCLDEMPVAVVQIEDAGFGGLLPSGVGDIREGPIPSVVVEHALTGGTPEEHVGPPVAVDVADRDAGSVGHHPIAPDARVADHVGESDAGLVAKYWREADVAWRHG